MPKRTPLSPTERVLRARVAAHAKHAQHDPRTTMDKARAVFLARFDRQADPEGVLSPAERERRAQQLRSAHFARLALASAKPVVPAVRRRREVADRPVQPGKKRAERV